MIENGHGWSDIKQYTLNEIGLFFNAIKVRNNVSDVNNLTYMWVANNADKKGLNSFIDNLKLKLNSDRSEEIRNNCLKLLNYNLK